ncbi:4-coumarate--CoA ligase family protein [Kutzneria viridogrisea]|uniref:Acyl-CoA synthetase (AMP-forming)/AMP-acid ligase II n=1 Tax=Kutzneria viridogrisea TaxID=47990 RepID=A0ABR6B904_9PSEU|nr:acyl-CoA synthetase (AMP-forming)/AMP-acid ligase II [Kutzneria viridogrisea]
MTASAWKDVFEAATRSLPGHVWGTGPGAVCANRIAVVDCATGRSATYRELYDLTRRIASWLSASGVGRADRVVLSCPNGVDLIGAFHGILLAGGTVLALDPRGGVREWRRSLRGHEVRSAILTTSTLRGFGELTSEVGKVLTVDEPGSLDEGGGVAGDQPSGSDVAVLAASSGTRGIPKQVMLTHGNLAVNLAQIDLLHQLTSEDVVLAVTPLWHIYGMQMAMNRALRARAKLVIAPTPVTPRNLVETIRCHGVTVPYLVPSILAELVRSEDVEDTDLAGMRLIFSGGAPLPAALAQNCTRRFGVAVVQGYGMTEAGCTHVTPDGDPGPPGAVGIALPGTETRIVDLATGTDVIPGDEGELRIRGPQVSSGYFGDPASSVALTDSDGWLHTGDLARAHPRGHVTITGRHKRLIKYKGYQVSPEELESLLLEYPGVEDAVVVGHPDDIAGELPKAYVVLRHPVDLDEIIAHVAGRVSPHNKLRLIEEVDSIPRNAMGKPRLRAQGKGV